MIGTLKSGTKQDSTSGTAIDFTSIPSWVKRITIMLSGVNTNSGSLFMVQLGTSSTPETSGYLGGGGWIFGTDTCDEVALTNSFYAGLTGVSGASLHGNVVITNIDSNTWCSSAATSSSGGNPYHSTGGGNKTLAGALDMVRITTFAGDTFTGGAINILYEG